MNLETGDIIFSSKNNIIVKFMRLFQKDPVFWGHVLIVKDNEIAWEANYILRERKIADVLKKNKNWKIIRHKYLIESQQKIMLKIAPKLLGRPYGIGRIFLQMFDHFFNTNWFTSKADWKFMQVCSSYVAWIYWVACRYKFNNVSWASCEPDDIEDDQLARPELWRVLNEKGLRRRK